MKKLLIGLCALSLIAASCTKEKCYLCVTTTTVKPMIGGSSTTYTGQNICDMSTEAKAAHEAKHTYTRTTEAATVIVTTTCKPLSY